MNHLSHLIVILSFVITCTSHARDNHASDPTGIFFFEGTLTELKAKANAEQKPYMVYFYTDWCEPCQSLNKETLSSEQVSRYLNEHYLTFKIDADISTRGEEALADQFSVDLFPTILIFGSSGELIEQFHGFKSPNELLVELSLVYDENAEMEPPMASPVPIPETQESLENLDYSYEPATPNQSQENVNEDNSFDVSSTLSEPVREEKTNSSRDLPRGDGLYQMKIQRHSSEGFAVQVGVFKEYQNAIFKMEQSKAYSDQDMLINVNSLNDEPVFKIMYGPFPTMTEAKSFMKTYQRETQQASILVDLSWFK